jgi:hypothetical protein
MKELFINPNIIVQEAFKYEEELKQIHEQTSSMPHVNSNNQNAKWLVPNQGWHKAN